MLHNFTLACIDFYAWLVYFGKWFFLIGFLVSTGIQVFYFNSNKFIFSKLKFVPVLNELCFFDDNHHRTLIIFEFISLTIAHTFYSVLFLIVGLGLRVFLMYRVATINFDASKAWLFSLCPFYRMYIEFNTAMETLIKNEEEENKKKLKNRKE